MRAALVFLLLCWSTVGSANDWDIDPSFEVSKDADGFIYPTALHFVPQPGPGPKDPLYYVAEIRGTIKVVTNDRSVKVFAEHVSNYVPPTELPSEKGEAGLTALCLDARTGYIFASYTFHDEHKAIRNSIARFSTRPKVFATRPEEKIIFTGILQGEPSNISHLIGGCQVRGKYLYVSVGDAELPYKSRDKSSTLGKILRFNLDGSAPRTNPFYTDNGKDDVQDYVWSYGLRNAFGLRFINGRLLSAENGPSVDRVHEIRGGRDYHWSGHDWSIALNSIATYSPTISPVQTDFIPSSRTDMPPEFRGGVTYAAAGSSEGQNPAGVILLPFDQQSFRATAPSRYFVRYRNKEKPQRIAAASLGPDGFYFVPLYPDEQGGSWVRKLTYVPGRELNAIPPERDGFEILQQKGCLGCHSIYNHGSYLAPALDPLHLEKRLLGRLDDAAYLEFLDAMDQVETEPTKSYRFARDELRGLKGSPLVRRWVYYHILEPKFDNPYSAMPNLQLTEHEAKLVAEFLIPSYSLLDRVRLRLERRYSGFYVVAVSSAASLLVAAVMIFLFGLVWWRFRVKAKRSGSL